MDQAELLGLAQEGERVGGGRAGVDVVREREIENALERIGRDTDLPPDVVELGTIVHQVHAIFQGDPDGGLQQVFQAFFVLGLELPVRAADSCGRGPEPTGPRRRCLRARESWR